MIKTFYNLITWTTPTLKEEQNTWEEWQRYQQPSHYEKSEIFQFYLFNKPDFRPPQYSCIDLPNSKYYIYCFGDFATFLLNVKGSNNSIEYFTLLLDFYDTCKGFKRRITGDPNHISILREVVEKSNLLPLINHDFNQYNYNYDTIHAHTVAQFSLSTLIMRLISHYLGYISTRTNYSTISLQICQKAHDAGHFGIPKTYSDISQQQIEQSNECSKDQSKCSRCKSCSRICENTWGNFTSCLDCHLKRICSECGEPAIIIGIDNLPKCCLHQEEQ